MSASHTPGRIVSTDNVTLAKAIYGEESPEYALFRLEAERDALKALNAELVKVVQIAYTILADVRHQWPGRHTAEGQGALVAMREAIAEATGRDPQDVQDEAQAVK